MASCAPGSAAWMSRAIATGVGVRVADALDYLAHKKGLDGKCFHLTDSDPHRIGEVLNIFARAAHAPLMTMRVNARMFGFIPAPILYGLGSLAPVKRMVRAVLKDLGIDTSRFYKAYDQNLYSKLGTACFFYRETFGEDRLVPGLGSTPWPEFLAKAPLKEEVRRDIFERYGEKKLYGEYLTNAQGEDVVAGVRTPVPIAELERHGYLSNLYVRPAERGGIGTQLVGAVIAWARASGIDRVVLWPSTRSVRPTMCGSPTTTGPAKW